MSIRFSFILTLLTWLIICSSCVAQVVGFGLSETGESASGNTEGEGEQSIEEIVESYDLRARIAQLMFVKLKGVHGLSPEDDFLISNYPPGGVVLPAIVDHGAVAEYVKSIRLKAAENSKGFGLFITASLTGNSKDTPLKTNVFRNLPSQLAIAAAYDNKCTERFLKVLAGHLKEIGLNTFLGPSLELAPTLPDALVTTSCFGSDPEAVADVTGDYIKHFRENDLLVMPTGFPGGGNNRLRKSQAVLLTPASILAKKDLLPYIRSIEEGVELIHVGNTLVPMLDSSGSPASLSHAVMKTLLKGELGFKGVVVAGPVDRWDIGDNMGVSEAAIASLSAGADMLYWGEGGLGMMRAVEDILKAVREGRLLESEINESLGRVLRLKRENSLIKQESPVIKPARKYKMMQELSDEILLLEKHAITMVKNNKGVIPFSKEMSLPLGITGTSGVDELHDSLEEYIKPIAQQAIRTAAHLGDIQDFEIMRVTSRAKGIKTLICVLDNIRKTSGQVKLVKELRKKCPRLIVIFLGYPSDISSFSDADAILLSYGSATSERMKAIAEVLVGQGPLRMFSNTSKLLTVAGNVETLDVRRFVCVPSGRLPVTINPPFIAGYQVGYDPTSAIKKVEWSFNDGQHDNEMTVKHDFATQGDHKFTLKITDNSGNELSNTYNVIAE